MIEFAVAHLMARQNLLPFFTSLVGLTVHAGVVVSLIRYRKRATTRRLSCWPGRYLSVALL